MTRPEVSGNFFNWWEIFGGLRTVGARLPTIEVDQALLQSQDWRIAGKRAPTEGSGAAI
jgi:hypothetical protein